MDKLQPLITHRFWVLFGLAIPLTLGGYFAAKSIKATTEEREQKLKSTLDGVPSGNSEPNDDYAAKLKLINGDLQGENDVEVQKLWEAQRSRMHWPTIMVKNNYLPSKFRGEIARSARDYYTTVYPDIIKRVWERAEPMVDNPPPKGLEVDWQQKVLLLPETVPRHYFDRNIPPSNKQVWDAQEDVWLMELIFDGIARANRDATWIGEATVRRIDLLELTGGSGTSSVATTADAGMGDGYDDLGFEDGGMDSGMGAMGGLGFDLSMMSTMGMGGMGGMQSMTQSVAFSPAEEFGPPVPEPTEDDGTGGDDEFSDDPFGSMGMDPSSMAGMGSMFSSLGLSGAAMGQMGVNGMGDMYRYIGDPSTAEGAPFRERGFYMSVIVMLPKLPDFFAEMASLDWPIRIGRYNIGPNPYAPVDTGGSSTGGFSSRGLGGLGGGLAGLSGMGLDPSMLSMIGGSGDLSSLAGMAGGMGMGGGSRRPPPGGMGGGNMANMLSSMGDMSAMFGASSGMGGMAGMRGMAGMQGMAGAGGSLPLPRSMRGPSEIDPQWFAHPDLVQVDFCAIITMYNPVTNNELIPTSDGSSEEETLKALEEQEQALEEEAAQAESEAENPSDSQSPSDGEPAAESDQSPSDGAATDDPPAKEEEAVEIETESQTPADGSEPSPADTPLE